MTGHIAPTMGLDEYRTSAHGLAEQRRIARVNYEAHSHDEADAERDFRKTMAVAYAKARSGGETSSGAEIMARAESADARHRRDLAASKARAAQMRIAELERDASILRSIAAWSQGIDGMAAG